MLNDRIRDRNSYALGVAARHIGKWADAFRPAGHSEPLDPQNRYLRLPAYFQPARGGMNQTNMPGDPFWHGMFDTAYTRVGDYIRAADSVYYIAAQCDLLPVLCIQTNRTISLSRPVVQSAVSNNAYGGFTAASAVRFLTKWPASVLTNNRTVRPDASLPTDVHTGFLSILVPRVDGLTIADGDILTDDLGRSASIAASELTDLGWRLTAKLIAN